MPFENYLPMIVGSLILVLLILGVARMAHVVGRRLLDTDQKAREAFINASNPTAASRKRQVKEDESRERWGKVQAYRRTTGLLLLIALGIVLIDLILVLMLTTPWWLALPLIVVFIVGVGYLAYRYLRPKPFPSFPSTPGEAPTHD